MQHTPPLQTFAPSYVPIALHALDASLSQNMSGRDSAPDLGFAGAFYHLPWECPTWPP